MKHILNYIKNSSPDSSVYIGCDSKVYYKDNVKIAKYTIVIIVHHSSSKGCKIFYDTINEPCFNIKQRLLREVNLSVEKAIPILDIIGDRHLEIHLDLNPDPKHLSNVAVREAIGYVKGLGVEHKLKPMAFAASSVADRKT